MKTATTEKKFRSRKCFELKVATTTESLFNYNLHVTYHDRTVDGFQYGLERLAIAMLQLVPHEELSAHLRRIADIVEQNSKPELKLESNAKVSP